MTTRKGIGAMFVVIVVIIVIVIGTLGFVMYGSSSPATAASSSSQTMSTTYYNELTNSTVRDLSLDVATNASTLSPGQALDISISLSNTTPAELNLTAVNDWVVSGFPVAMFPGCVGQEPVQFAIVAGNYSLDELRTASINTSAGAGIMCAEGGSIRYYAFSAESNSANLTGFFCTANCFPKAWTYQLVTNFTTSGYWIYPLNQSDILTPAHPSCTINGIPGGCITYNYPEEAPITDHQFVEGEYTLVVSDEWGQVVIVHFTVEG